MEFIRTNLDKLTPEQADWLRPAAGVRKVSYERMLSKIEQGVFKLWLLGDPAEGLTVTYPDKDLLFIYYLHGRGLFDNLTIEDLLRAARNEGLSGMVANVESPGMKRLCQRFGFKVTITSPYGYEMELRDG